VNDDESFGGVPVCGQADAGSRGGFDFYAPTVGVECVVSSVGSCL